MGSVDAIPMDGGRRDEILDTASQLFASSGLRTSLLEIADACGIQPGSLYHHFDSKEAIVVELVQRYHGELDRIAETALEELDFHWGEDFFETAPYSGNKVARYYLAGSESQQVKLPVNPQLGRPEHHEFRWVGFDGAAKLVVPRISDVLAWARARVES